MKMAGRSIISTVCYPSTERSKYSNCTVNPGQTRIFYKAGQTRMIRMTRPSFNADTVHITPLVFMPLGLAGIVLGLYMVKHQLVFWLASVTQPQVHICMHIAILCLIVNQ